MRAEARGIIIHRARRLFRTRLKHHCNLLVIFQSTEPRRPSLSLLASLTFYDLSDRKRRRGTKIGRTRTPGRNDNFPNLERKRRIHFVLFIFLRLHPLLVPQDAWAVPRAPLHARRLLHRRVEQVRLRLLADQLRRGNVRRR